jgi:hypothetical protein
LLVAFNGSGKNMKKLFCLLILLGGCSQEYIDQRNAERDSRMCESLGILPGHASYLDCRVYAAQMRLQEQANINAAAGSALGFGASIYSTSQPRQPTTCSTIGNMTTCN